MAGEVFARMNLLGNRLKLLGNNSLKGISQ